MDTIINQIPPWALTPLVLGFVLDSIIGDPHRLPHPIRLFGKLIFIGERLLNKGKNRILKGGLLTFILTGIVFIFLFFVLSLLRSYPYFQLIVESILVFFGIANRNLIEECLKVEKTLKIQGLDEARKQLSTIVGRDTEKLSKNQVRKATLETLSENLGDGVIAPLFYFAIGGIPLMFAYKMVNTLDSMIGHKNEQFKKFGFIAAKTDDVLNFIPARLTALLMVLVTFSRRGLIFIVKYGNKHSSPNAGYPEAALAGILNCKFGGANYYHGKIVNKPDIGNHNRSISDKDLKKAALINVFSSLLLIIIIVTLNVMNKT